MLFTSHRWRFPQQPENDENRSKAVWTNKRTNKKAIESAIDYFTYLFIFCFVFFFEESSDELFIILDIWVFSMLKICQQSTSTDDNNANMIDWLFWILESKLAASGEYFVAWQNEFQRFVIVNSAIFTAIFVGKTIRAQVIDQIVIAIAVELELQNKKFWNEIIVNSFIEISIQKKLNYRHILVAQRR